MPAKKTTKTSTRRPNITRGELEAALDILLIRMAPLTRGPAASMIAEELETAPPCSPEGRRMLKQNQSSGTSPNLKISRSHVVRRTLVMLRCRTGRDYSHDNPGAPMPDPPTGAPDRGKFASIANADWFDDVNCRVAPAALKAATTLAAFCEGIYLGVPSAHRIP